MNKLQADKFFEINDYMQSNYSYIYFETPQLKKYIKDNWNRISEQKTEIATDHFQDFLLANGECEVEA